MALGCIEFVLAPLRHHARFRELNYNPVTCTEDVEKDHFLLCVSIFVNNAIYANMRNYARQ